MSLLPERLFPENISTYGQEIDDLFYMISIPVGIAFVVSLIILIYPLIKYRFSEGRKASYILGEGKQLKWLIIPLAVLALCDFYILFAEHPTWHKIEETLPEPELEVAVIGRQFMWTIVYPGPDGKLYTGDDVMKVNELHVPKDAVIHVDLKALDVLHSFFIPNVRLKQDCLPGRTITRWFEATKEGKYEILCAEICGTGHSIMKGNLIVHSQENFDKYMNELYKK